MSKLDYLKKYLGGSDSASAPESSKPSKPKKSMRAHDGTRLVDDDIDIHAVAPSKASDDEGDAFYDDAPVIVGEEETRAGASAASSSARAGSSGVWQAVNSDSTSRIGRGGAATGGAVAGRRQRLDSDEAPAQSSSPPRRRHDSDDEEPPRRAAAAPPARAQASDSPSPPRRGAARMDSDEDVEVPRKRRAPASPSPSPSRSPPRRPSAAAATATATAAALHAADDDEAEPPRRKRQRYDSDQEEEDVPRRRSAAASSSAGVAASASSSSAAAAGPASAAALRAAAAAGVDVKAVSGTVYRDKQGRKIDIVTEMARAAEAAAATQVATAVQKYEWATGTAQKAERQAAAAELSKAAAAPFARHADDAEMNAMLRQRSRAGDPMAGMLSSGGGAGGGEGGGRSLTGKPPYTGPSGPPNRFGIKPGYRWDGVDRSNGWEAKVVAQVYSAKAKEERDYKYRVADM